MENSQAFPCLDSSGYGLSMRDPGMTLRDYFAGQAMIGVAAYAGEPVPAELLAKAAYGFADAMLEARKVQP